jgi:hypothetical protein
LQNQLRTLEQRIEKRERRAKPVSNGVTAGEYFAAALHHRTGHVLRFKDVYAMYLDWCKANGREPLGRTNFSRSIQAPFVTGTYDAGYTMIGNLAVEPGPHGDYPVVVTDRGRVALEGHIYKMRPIHQATAQG